MIQDDPSIIDQVLEQIQTTFGTGKTHNVSFRLAQLKQLYKGVSELEQEFHDALALDLGVDNFGSQLYSTLITKIDIEHNIQNLSKWVKPKKVQTPLVIGPASSKIVYEPLGVALVLGAWNYPLYTSVPPVAAAIAAGNCVALKPSELSPHTSNVMKKLFDIYLDKSCYQVIQGGIEVAKSITTKKWDLIIFTGSPEKGKLVAKAASDNLIPCILELGGKSPTIVDKSANITLAAQRVTQGRFINAGQTCVACDYVLVHEHIKNEFLQEIIKQIKIFYGNDALQSKDYSRIVTQAHTQRLVDMLNQNDHKGKIIYGGQYDINQKYVEPTIIEQPNLNSKLMKEEIFGPILPVLTYNNFNEVIKYINSNDKPLAIYYFGNKKEHKELLEQKTSSGGLAFNDAAFHLLNPNLPFGGVGQSGYSAYHGIYGFKNCSHAKAVFDKSTINFWPFNLRYPPFTNSKQRNLLFLFKFSSLQQGTLINYAIFSAIVIGVLYGRAYPDKKAQFTQMLKSIYETMSQGLPRL